MEKKYTVRQLKTSDLFKMSKILKKMNLKMNVQPKKEGEQLNMIFDLLNEFISNIHLAENEVNQFMGDLVGISGEEFGELHIDDTMDIFSQFKDLDGVANFLKLANK